MVSIRFKTLQLQLRANRVEGFLPLRVVCIFHRLNDGILRNLSEDGASTCCFQLKLQKHNVIHRAGWIRNGRIRPMNRVSDIVGGWRRRCETSRFRGVFTTGPGRRSMPDRFEQPDTRTIYALIWTLPFSDRLFKNCDAIQFPPARTLPTFPLPAAERALARDKPG